MSKQKPYWIRFHKNNSTNFRVFNSKPTEYMSYEIIKVIAVNFKEAEQMAEILLKGSRGIPSPLTNKSEET